MVSVWLKQHVMGQHIHQSYSVFWSTHLKLALYILITDWLNWLHLILLTVTDAVTLVVADFIQRRSVLFLEFTTITSHVAQWFFLDSLKWLSSDCWLSKSELSLIIELTDRVNFPCSVKSSQNEWLIRSVICIQAEEMNRDEYIEGNGRND